MRPDALWTREGLEGTFNWGLTQLIERNGQMGALLGISIAVVVIFLFKNFFRYLAVVAICNFRNYIVRDIRGCGLQQDAGAAAAVSQRRTQRRSARA